jgi:hypothetical protein
MGVRDRRRRRVRFEAVGALAGRGLSGVRVWASVGDLIPIRRRPTEEATLASGLRTVRDPRWAIVARITSG